VSLTRTVKTRQKRLRAIWEGKEKIPLTKINKHEGIPKRSSEFMHSVKSNVDLCAR